MAFRVLLIEDGVIPTASGRRIPPPPRIRAETRRKAQNDRRKVAQWLVAQAREEAMFKADNWNEDMFRRMRPERLTPIDWDMANDYLFGVECVFCMESADAS
jgi:hypothetical protein